MRMNRTVGVIGLCVATAILLGQTLWAGELIDAVKKGEAKAVSQIAASNAAQMSVTDETGQTPLHWAARGGDVAIVKALLAAGANVKARDAYGNTPLLLAALQGHTKAVTALLAAGADVKAAALNKYTPLHLAAWSGKSDMIKLLVDREADAHAQDYDMRTPLHYASTRAAVEALLAAGAEVNARWLPWTRTPLLDAGMHGFPEVVAALLDRGADITATDSSHFTALHWAAWNGCAPAVKILLARGADAYYQDDSGYNALFWAQYWGHKDVIQMLKDHMAKTPCKADPQRP